MQTGATAWVDHAASPAKTRRIGVLKQFEKLTSQVKKTPEPKRILAPEKFVALYRLAARRLGRLEDHSVREQASKFASAYLTELAPGNQLPPDTFNVRDASHLVYSAWMLAPTKKAANLSDARMLRASIRMKAKVVSRQALPMLTDLHPDDATRYLARFIVGVGELGVEPQERDLLRGLANAVYQVLPKAKKTPPELIARTICSLANLPYKEAAGIPESKNVVLKTHPEYEQFEKIRLTIASVMAAHGERIHDFFSNRPLHLQQRSRLQLRLRATLELHWGIKAPNWLTEAADKQLQELEDPQKPRFSWFSGAKKQIEHDLRLLTNSLKADHPEIGSIEISTNEKVDGQKVAFALKVDGERWVVIDDDSKPPVEGPTIKGMPITSVVRLNWKKWILPNRRRLEQVEQAILATYPAATRTQEVPIKLDATTQFAKPQDEELSEGWEPDLD